MQQKLRVDQVTNRERNRGVGGGFFRLPFGVQISYIYTIERKSFDARINRFLKLCGIDPLKRKEVVH